jgi:hypothetical protein
MNRRDGLRLIVAILVVVVAFGAWWTISTVVLGASGFHVVDGHWLGPERTCTDANAPEYCAAAIQTATQVLEAQRPDANMVRAAIAPPSSSSTGYVVCAIGGLSHPVFVVFDLGDGSRIAVGVGCRGTVTQGSQVMSTPACAPELIPNQEAGTP